MLLFVACPLRADGIHMAQLIKDDFEKDLDLVTINGARVMNLEDSYGLDIGKDANFIVLDAVSPFDAIRNRAECLASVRGGEFLFKKAKRTYEINLDI